MFLLPATPRLYLSAVLYGLLPATALADASGNAALPDALTNTLLIGTTILILASLLLVVKTLKKQGWSLAQALAEESTLPDGSPTPAAGDLPPLIASSSRLIALIGTIVLGSFFVATGYFVLWRLCHGQSIAQANDAWSFFLAGASLYLPYGANKVASIFKTG
ncbi:MAG: hypothetical protein JO338_08070 [Aquitalea sp.]|nr:hypothetical protein [Aquitalea sp.]